MSKVLSDIHISVILPVLNGAATLEAQLGSLAHQTYRGRWELIIADNGSSDKTREIAEAWRLRLRTMVVLDASGRPGPAAARNAAARVARGDIFAFCDADDVASPRWLEACAAASDQHQFIGGGLDYYSLNPSAPPWKRRALLEPRKTPWGERFADSANMVVSRTAFEAVAGFSEDMLRGADVDLSWRLEAAGSRWRWRYCTRVTTGPGWRQPAAFGDG
jgi:glycosyltransferase involved in cell wall biosynthesis